MNKKLMQPKYCITMLSSANELFEFKDFATQDSQPKNIEVKLTEFKDIGSRTKHGNTDYVKNIALLRPFLISQVSLYAIYSSITKNLL